MDKLDLLILRRWKCDFCGGKAEDVHHCLIPKNYHRQGTNIKECEEIFNLAVLCKKCHKYKTGYKWRLKFWKIQCSRFRTRIMVDWLDRVPLVEKPKYV